jgi:hypothetical protein
MRFSFTKQSGSLAVGSVVAQTITAVMIIMMMTPPSSMLVRAFFVPAAMTTTTRFFAGSSNAAARCRWMSATAAEEETGAAATLNKPQEESGFQYDFTMEDVVSLCKRRGIIFPSSEIYNGFAGFYDYGPLGVELKKNVKDAWWRFFVTQREDVVGLDSSIIHNPTTWKSSGTLLTTVLILEFMEIHTLVE